MQRMLYFIARFSRSTWVTAPLATLALCSFALLPSSGRSQDGQELRISSRDWNGLSRLAQEGGAVGVRVTQEEDLEVSSANTRDGLLIIHPTKPLPRYALSAFMRRGGRIALLDDFGTGQDLLSVFNVRRGEPDLAVATPRLRNRREFAIATPVGEHPLTIGVEALVTNHAQTLHHPQLEPVFALGDASQALALSGAVGEGRLVAFGDSSVVINNMLDFTDNRRFARNLLRYLSGEHHGQVVVVSGDAQLRDESDLKNAKNPVAFVRDALQRMAERPPNAAALQVATWAIVVGLLLAALTALPPRSAYEHLRGVAALPQQTSSTQFTYSEAVLRLDQELRAAIEHALKLPSGSTRSTLVAAVTEQTHDTRLARRLQRLLGILDLHHSRPLTAAAIPISGRRFRKLVAEGERIVGALRVVVA